MADPNPFVVRKRDVRVKVLLSNGKELDGVIQCNLHADHHHGRERVKDVLNRPDALVPIWSLDDDACVLINKSFIELLTLEEPDLAEPGETDLTEHREVTVVLASGRELSGTIMVSTPPERARTLDFLNRGERFFYLETAEGSRVIGLAHLVAARDSAPSPQSQN